MHVRSRLLVPLAAACALAFASFVPGSARATTGGCLWPTIMLSLYFDSGSGAVILGDLSEDQSTCRKQCGALLKGCLDVVASAAECFGGDIDSLFASEQAQCNEIGGGEGKACRQENQSDQKSFRDGLREALAVSRDECRAAHDECLAICDGKPL